MDCEHSKIKVIRFGRGYMWTCALCGDYMLTWDRKVWETLGLDELEQGEGFVFNIVERQNDKSNRNPGTGHKH